MRKQGVQVSNKWAARIFVGVLALLLPGCDRRDITYYLESELYIHADWRACTLDPSEEGHGATTIFFTDDGTARQVLMGTRQAETVRLPPGNYHAILFNRSPEGFGTIRFTGDTFDTYTASVRQVETRTDPGTRQVTRVLLNSPEDVAADIVTGFVVTETMLGNYSQESVMNRSSKEGGSGTRGDATTRDGFTRAEESDPERYTLRFMPLKLTLRITITIHLEGINNLRSATGIIDGVSESIRLGSGEPSPATAAQCYTLDHVAYDAGSPFNGTLSGEFNVFGFDLGNEHTLTLRYLLIDGVTTVEHTYRAMPRVSEDGNGELVIGIHVAPPEKLPTVKPEGSPDSGFDADVDEWGEPEEEEIPLS